MLHLQSNKLCDIITLAQFEEGDISTETSKYAERYDKSGDKSDDDSIMPPLLSVEENNALYYGDVSDDESMSTEML